MKLQQTNTYLLLLDEEAEISEKPYFIWKDEVHKFHSDSGYGIKTWTDYNEEDGSSLLVNWSNKQKGSIVGYYPRTKEAKELEGVPLLPNPFRKRIDIEKLAEKRFPTRKPLRNVNTVAHEKYTTDIFNLKSGFITGYKAAQSDKQFSLEDMKEAMLKAVINNWQDYSLLKTKAWIREYIQSLSTQQLPVDFIPFYDLIITDNIDTEFEGDLFLNKEVLKTTINVQGKRELVGEYKY